MHPTHLLYRLRVLLSRLLGHRLPSCSPICCLQDKTRPKIAVRNPFRVDVAWISLTAVYCFMSRPQIQSKAEWLLGYTHAQMSYRKALEVLGVSEAVVEEERARRLGELGVASWGAARSGAGGLSGREMDDRCGGFFTKRRRPSQDAESTLGTTLPGEIAFAPAHVRPEYY